MKLRGITRLRASLWSSIRKQRGDPPETPKPDAWHRIEIQSLQAFPRPVDAFLARSTAFRSRPHYKESAGNARRRRVAQTQRAVQDKKQSCARQKSSNAKQHMQFIRQCFGMSKKVPQRIVDPHHHFYTPSVEEGPGGHSGFLRKLGAPDYPPEEYVKDKAALNIVKSVHVEALPDDGVQEAAWVASLIDAGRAPTVKAIVGKVDLAAPDAAQKLDALVKTSDLVKGVRYIIDYDGPWGEDNGTHPEVSRHGKDYLRGPNCVEIRCRTPHAIDAMLSP